MKSAAKVSESVMSKDDFYFGASETKLLKEYHISHIRLGESDDPRYGKILPYEKLWKLSPTAISHLTLGLGNDVTYFDISEIPKLWEYSDLDIVNMCRNKEMNRLVLEKVRKNKTDRKITLPKKANDTAKTPSKIKGVRTRRAK